MKKVLQLLCTNYPGDIGSKKRENFKSGIFQSFLINWKNDTFEIFTFFDPITPGKLVPSNCKTPCNLIIKCFFIYTVPNDSYHFRADLPLEGHV